MNPKSALRREFSEKRKNIPQKREKSIAITEKFIASEIYKNSETIMLFYPKNNEVNTLFLFERALKDGKKTVFPYTDTKTNEIIPIFYEKGFLKGAYGIFEPLGNKICDKNKIDVVIVPALSVDSDNFRLGYGGGYYDRFLRDYKGKKITFLFSDLKTDKLPSEKFDIKTDIIITE